MPNRSNPLNEEVGADEAEQPVIVDRPDLLPERPKRVLVALGDRSADAEASSLLTESGYLTLAASAAGDAVELARSAEPDVAIVDPAGNGVEVAAALYIQEAVPVVALATTPDRELADRAVEAGVFGYLIRPASREQLRAAVEVAWRRFVIDATERCEGAKLKKRLEERKVVEQAKWILVSTAGMTEPDAMRHLQKQARSTRKQLIDVASEVIRSHPTT